MITETAKYRKIENRESHEKDSFFLKKKRNATRDARMAGREENVSNIFSSFDHSNVRFDDSSRELVVAFVFLSYSTLTPAVDGSSRQRG